MALGLAGVTGSVPARAGTAAPPSPQPASEPNPSVDGPVPWSLGVEGQPQTDNLFSLATLGYSEQEYFVSGAAKKIANSSSVENPSLPTETATAPYTTRMIVRRPLDAARFNGTVVVEWDNVTAQMDEVPVWNWSYPTALGEGFAYVIVSVQQAGICCGPLSLKARDPIRYASLSHPGDDYAFDMYSQVLQSLRHPAPGAVDPLGGLTLTHLIAAGQSQSADELYDYLNTVPYGGLVDGFLLAGGGQTTYPGAVPPSVPVLNVFDELTAPSTPPNVTANYRLWEIAGGSHADYFYLRAIFDDAQMEVPGDGQRDQAWQKKELAIDGDYGYAVDGRELSCVPGGNMFPSHYVIDNALDNLNRWMAGGAPPATVPMLQFNATTGQPATDQYGNALGGYRLPPIDVPVARYIPTDCGFFGQTLQLDPATLAQLYPTHQDYVADMQAATDAAVAKGLLLPNDAADLMARARGSAIPQLQTVSPLPPTG
ncbi:MAG: hypothetical protein JO085_11390 [Acidimicrobiia bacterium]|nr:hypothetical protein [Acidimicrobiia bacterium]